MFATVKVNKVVQKRLLEGRKAGTVSYYNDHNANLCGLSAVYSWCLSCLLQPQ